MTEVAKKLLRSIAKHDGQWGWYQLDRVVNPSDLPKGLTVMDILRELESLGLAVAISSTPQDKYSITELGRDSLGLETAGQ